MNGICYCYVGKGNFSREKPVTKIAVERVSVSLLSARTVMKSGSGRREVLIGHKNYLVIIRPFEKYMTRHLLVKKWLFGTVHNSNLCRRSS